MVSAVILRAAEDLLSQVSKQCGTTDPSAAARPEDDRRPPLQVAARRLLALDRLEQGLEVPLAEAPRALPFDDLVEERRPVLHRLGENLQQIAVRITVDENAEGLQLGQRLVDRSDAVLEVVVVRRRHREKLDTAIAERRHGTHDVVRRQREMLHARPTIELEILVDL